MSPHQRTQKWDPTGGIISHRLTLITKLYGELLSFILSDVDLYEEMVDCDNWRHYKFDETETTD